MGLVTRRGATVLIYEPGTQGNPRADANMLQCQGCTATHFLVLPMPVDKFVKQMKAFDVLHADCLPRPGLDRAR